MTSDPKLLSHLIKGSQKKRKDRQYGENFVRVMIKENSTFFAKRQKAVLKRVRIRG